MHTSEAFQNPQKSNIVTVGLPTSTSPMPLLCQKDLYTNCLLRTHSNLLHCL
jgi:hypothetical protein